MARKRKNSPPKRKYKRLFIEPGYAIIKPAYNPSKSRPLQPFWTSIPRLPTTHTNRADVSISHPRNERDPAARLTPA